MLAPGKIADNVVVVAFSIYDQWLVCYADYEQNDTIMAFETFWSNLQDGILQHGATHAPIDPAFREKVFVRLKKRGQVLFDDSVESQSRIHAMAMVTANPIEDDADIGEEAEKNVEEQMEQFAVKKEFQQGSEAFWLLQSKLNVVSTEPPDYETSCA